MWCGGSVDLERERQRVLAYGSRSTPGRGTPSAEPRPPLEPRCARLPALRRSTLVLDADASRDGVSRVGRRVAGTVAGSCVRVPIHARSRYAYGRTSTTAGTALCAASSAPQMQAGTGRRGSAVAPQGAVAGSRMQSQSTPGRGTPTAEPRPPLELLRSFQRSADASRNGASWIGRRTAGNGGEFSHAGPFDARRCKPGPRVADWRARSGRSCVRRRGATARPGGLRPRVARPTVGASDGTLEQRGHPHRRRLRYAPLANLAA